MRFCVVSRLRQTFLCSALLLLCGQISRAAPNGLTQIPLAKVFGDGVAAFSLERAAQSSQVTVFTTQYGIGNQIELGADYQSAPSSQQTLLGNIKALIVHSPARLPDVAVGVQNIAVGYKAVPYLVATTQPRATGFSLGVIRPAASYEVMGGISYNLTPRFEIVTDAIGGHADYATLGFIDSLSPTLTLNVAYARPNSPDNGTNPCGYVVNFAYVFHLKGGARASGSPPSQAKPTSGAGGTGK